MPPGSSSRVRAGAAPILLLLAGLALSACTPTSREDGAARVASRFVADVGRHDGAAACRLLTESARESVTGATDATCRKAVVNVAEHGTAVRRVQVWGDSAQVRIGTDVVFLVHLRAGWRVTAAGCKSQPHAPYLCDVDG
jgi:hypothetical protein